MISRAFNKKLDADGVIRITPPARKCSACGGKIPGNDLAAIFQGPARCMKCCSDPRGDEPTIRTKPQSKA